MVPGSTAPPAPRNPPVDDVDEADEDTAVTDPGVDRGPRLIAGRYAVQRQIAKGGMGEVLLARHVDLERSVALKVMAPPKEAEKIDFEERFRTEAKTLASFVHPNIVTVHDFGVLDDGRCFLAMEYVEGRTLAEVLKQGPLAPSRAIALALQVCGALRYAHARGVVHRDLTPSNLLLTTGPDHGELVKLVDWGIVKVAETDAEETQGGIILGSPHVMAPEQIDGFGVDARTDIYQVGVLLFRMITGLYPYRGNNTMAVLMAHLEQPIPRFADVAPGVDAPEGLEAVVHRCLAKDREERWPGVEALREELAAVLALPESAYVTAAIVPAAGARSGVARPTDGAAEVAPASVATPLPWRLIVLAVVVFGLALAFAGTAVGLRIGQRAAVDAAPAVAAPAPAPPAEAAPRDEAPATTPAPTKPAEAPSTPSRPGTRSSTKPAATKPAAAKPAATKPAAPKSEPAKPAAPKGYEGVPNDL